MTAFLRGPTVAVAAVALLGVAAAHDIPADVTARLIVKPAGERAQVLVRVPLSSMRDIDFPAQPNGYLDVEALAPRLPDLATQWIAAFVELYEDGERLPPARVAEVQISLPSDRSFESFEQGLARIRAPLPANGENLTAEQVLFDVLLEYPIRSEHSPFAMRPGLEHLASSVTTALTFHMPGGEVRGYQFHRDPGRVPLDPSWGQAAGRFVELGFLHILDGPDHLLFLLCLVIPFRRLRALIWIVTAFTIAHSITLLASAFGLTPDALWFPPLIETLIALTVVYVALENIVGVSEAHRRWMVAFGFGLIHGFGFAFALRETLQFAGAHLTTSLLSFNVGVELGQILVLLLLVPVLDALFRFVVSERIGTIILSALVAHTGWHWLLERGAALRLYDMSLSSLTASDWAAATQALLWIAVAAGAIWAFSLRRRRRADDAA